MEYLKDNYLITTGGAGSNFVYRKFGIDNFTNGLGVKFNPHQRAGKLDSRVNIIYLGANPIDIIMSYHRRGFFEEMTAVHNLEGNVNRWAEVGINSLSDYIENGENLFQFGSHFLGWLKAYKNIHWFSYDNIQRELLFFLYGLGLEELTDEPVKPRNNWDPISERELSLLYEIHKEDIRIFDKHFLNK